MKILRSSIGSLPSLGLIKELEKHDIEIIGYDANPLTFGSVYLKKSYVVPYAKEKDKFIKKIFEIIEIEKPDAILCGHGGETLILSEYKEKIEKMDTVLLCPNYSSVLICQDKLYTHQFFKKHNIPCPDLFKFGNTDFKHFPYFIKPRNGSGSKNSYKTNTFEELRSVYQKVLSPIIQDFIDGKEYSIDTLGDRDGNLVSVGIRERIKVSDGICIVGKTVYDKEMIKYSKKIVKELKLFGPSCIQCIKNESGIYFLEVNNRFGGGSILSIKANQRFISSLKQLITKEGCYPALNYTMGLMMFRNYTEAFRGGK